MEPIVKPVVLDLREKMEALVHDLSIALEESSNSVNVRRRWGIRRRARSTGNIPLLINNKQSEDSSSSMYDSNLQKNVEIPSLISKYQSDSDDGSNTKRFAKFSNLNIISNIESDSVNENFVPRATRRKRKFKRMAIDLDSNPSTSQTVITAVPSSIGKKKRIFRNDCENRYGAIWCGKRKRSCRERSTDCEMRLSKPNRSTKSKNRGKSQNENAMDCSHLSSSSISSSDSEAGLNTNDEDREGDDEQSDWFGESSWLDEGENTHDDKSINSLQLMIHGNYDNLSEEAKKNYRRLQWFRDGVNGREILAGRRHVDNTPGYSIISSANEKVSRFLQDPNQRELKLHPMRQLEREKLRRLANLYNLNLKSDHSCPILYKTKQTTQAICVDQVSLNRLSDFKRLRKTPPNSPNPDSEMNEEVHMSGVKSTYTNFPTNHSHNTELAQTNIPLYNWDGIKINKNETSTKLKNHTTEYSKSS